MSPLPSCKASNNSQFVRFQNRFPRLIQKTHASEGDSRGRLLLSKSLDRVLGGRHLLSVRDRRGETGNRAVEQQFHSKGDKVQIFDADESEQRSTVRGDAGEMTAVQRQ